ncbi:hypothetical protein WN55_01093 [Dufourea novaeangliae]|uniref:Uncharacterized protein n=1 Tax=Dufourea novaeangliae TaxID=178035 RepID=A0A154PFZ7_DUFNO|nr:hypothetical protein WN55_01093 [Dufourea novaeangliae]
MRNEWGHCFRRYAVKEKNITLLFERSSEIYALPKVQTLGKHRRKEEEKDD